MDDIILINFNSLLLGPKNNCNPGLVAIETYLKSHDIRCRIVEHTTIDQYLNVSQVFGFSVLDSTYEPASQITKKMVDKKIIWGGWTASAIPEWILTQNPNIDYIILGEGEERLEKLLSALKNKDSFDTLDGIAYRGIDKTIKVHPLEKYMDLNKSPMLAKLSVLNDLVFIELSRGCHGNCGYCQETAKMRFKSPVRLADEIECCLQQGYTRFYLGNANSLANGKLLARLMDEIENRNLFVEFALVGRPDDILRNERVIERYFKSKHVHLIFMEIGIEANSQHLLDLLQRRSTPDINKKAVQLIFALKENYSSPVTIHTNIIFFSHYDMTLDELMENIKFMGEFRTSRDTLSLQLYGVAGTPIWKKMVERGFKTQENFGLEITEYPFSDPYVEKLYQKMVKEPIDKAKKENRFTVRAINKIQNNCYNLLLDFYNSRDMRKKIYDFLETG